MSEEESFSGFDDLIGQKCSDATILVVEDSPIMVAMYESILAGFGTCNVAPDAKSAIRFIKQATPDLIVLDHHLPDSTGLSVCRNIRKHHAPLELPIVFITGSEDKELERQCWETGCSDFVQKPFEATTLRHRVHSHLQLKFAFDILHQFSTRDKLTGLLNRHYLDTVVSGLRSSQHKIASVLVIDIDFFKQYNDHYGHQMGDDCLSQVGQILKNNTRGPKETAVRYGGEEFVIVLPGETTEIALKVAERVRNSVEKAAIQHEKAPLGKVTVSIGVASSADASDWDSLLGDADKMLYKAKKSGRNTVCSEPVA